MWKPQSNAQKLALESSADILLFGGAAGSLKSETMLIDAVREFENRGLRAILFRRSYPELEKSLIRRSRELYPDFGGRYNEQKKIWKFPSGASVEFGYCESEKDIYRYQGAEYSFIGFDESTHFAEFPIRYMLSRLRSTESSLNLRVRLASNPSNIGHNTHKAIFHGSTCTHCRITAQSRRPGEIYHDAVWPSDRVLIRKSTCFIPGTVRDHTLLGADYLDSLASLPGVFRKALLEGCWDVYEGQYFDIWDPARMVVPRQSIPSQSWWPHWVGADYGFNLSQAAAYLFCKSPASEEFPHGRTYVLGEYAARHQKAADFAQSISRRFQPAASAVNHAALSDASHASSSSPRILAWYLSPDAWNQRGDDHCLADQMRQASGISFEPASNDRIGGAMLLYTQLDCGELLIADTCSQLIESLASRIHDPDRPDDVLKVSGDPLDDCFDAARYALYSYIAPPKPSLPSQLHAAVTSRDPTIAMLQRRLAEHRIEQQHRSVSFLRR